jgi:hypothetical protein
MYRRPSDLRAGTGLYCSRRCRNSVHGYGGKTGQHPPKPKPKYGASNPSWKGGVTFFKTHGNYTGVRYVRAPEWARPMARKDGYIMEHRLVMAAWMGRLLSRTEVVNHVDHDPSNNARSNLELWPTNADHKRGEFGRIVIGVANRRFQPDSERL